MLVRLRTRDGTERLSVPDDGNLRAGDLRALIADAFAVPIRDQLLSTNQALLTAHDDALAPFRAEFADDNALLSALGVTHGAMLFMRYTVERKATVQQVKANVQRFGAKMTVDDLVAKQIRIERQDQPVCASVSFERAAANQFQGYIGAALGFRIMRCGIMFGTVDAQTKEVKVDAIYEPPQPHNNEYDILCEHENTEEWKRVQAVAKLLGLEEVGCIFSQTARNEDDDFTVSSHEITRMAVWQSAARRRRKAESTSGEDVDDLYVTAVVKRDDGGDVHFEAFQCSTQFVDLCERGVIVDPRTPGKALVVPGIGDGDEAMAAATSADEMETAAASASASEDAPAGATGTVFTTRDVMVGIKDVREVDNDWFVVPVKILDHVHPLLTSLFAVENRLTPCGPAELKDHLQLCRGKPFAEALADFHILLFLSAHFDLATDMALLVDAVMQKGTVLDGYKTIVEAIAGCA